MFKSFISGVEELMGNNNQNYFAKNTFKNRNSKKIQTCIATNTEVNKVIELHYIIKTINTLDSTLESFHLVKKC